MVGFLNRLAGPLRHFLSAQHGFTALQTAIGTVAAVATAGTVSTVVVQSSTAASQDVEQAVYESIRNIQGTFMIKGPIYGKAVVTGSKGTIGQLSFDVALVCNDGFIDFTPPAASPENNGLAGPDSANIVVISYTDANQHVDDLYWTVTKLGKDNGDYVLEGGELFQITIGGSVTPGKDGGNLIDALQTDLSKDTAFSIDMGAPQGAVLHLEGETSSSIKKINVFP